MKRIWNVRLNVDEWNAGIAGLDDDADRIRFLAGFNAGLNGKETMAKGVAWEAGWKVGNSSHLEAIKFSDLQRSRVMNRYHGTTTVDPGNNQGTTTELPNDNLQSTIEVSTIDKPKIQKEREAPLRFTPPTLEEVQAYCQERGNRINPQRFVDRNESTGWMVGKNKMKSWKATIRTWEANDAQWSPVPINEPQAPPTNYGPPPPLDLGPRIRRP